MLLPTLTSLTLAALPSLSSGDAEGQIYGANDDRFGYQIVSGDLNSDGDVDLVISAPHQVGGNTVYVFFGPIDLGSAPTLDPGDADVVIEGPSGSEFGWSLALGDVVGDGGIDLIVGSPSEGSYGTVHVFEGPFVSASMPLDTGGALLTIEGHEEDYLGGSGYAGWSITAGDFDGDGEDELVIGACYAHVPGTAGGLGITYLLDTHGESGSMDTAGATTRITGAGLTGCSLANAGDFNGDGYEDLVVGSHGAAYTTGYTFGGMVSLIYGRDSFPGDIDLYTNDQEDLKEGDFANILAEFNTFLDGANFGYDIAAAGDVNEDGYPDLLIGAPARRCEVPNGLGGFVTCSVREHVGRTYLVLGGPDTGGDRVLAGMSRADAVADVIWEGEYDAWTGISVAGAGFAGELYSTYGYAGGYPLGGPVLLFGSGANVAHAIAYDREHRLYNTPDYECAEDPETGLLECVLSRYGIPTSRHVRRVLANLNGGGHEIKGDAGEVFGLEVHGPGDLDGDGVNDLVIGAPRQKTYEHAAGDGRVYLFAGQ